MCAGIIQDAITSYKKNGGSRLVIDLRNNGGGSICLGYQLMKFLFPDFAKVSCVCDSVLIDFVGLQSKNGDVVGRYDMIKSELFAFLATKAADDFLSSPSHSASFFTPSQWKNAVTKQYADRAVLVC